MKGEYLGYTWETGTNITSDVVYVTLHAPLHWEVARLFMRDIAMFAEGDNYSDPVKRVFNYTRTRDPKEVAEELIRTLVGWELQT